VAANSFHHLQAAAIPLGSVPPRTISRLLASVSVILGRHNAITEQRMTVAEQLFEQARLLPEPLAREALDFVLFLRARQDRGDLRDLMNAQSGVLAAVWDNAEDEVWNNV
jgi:hypothetical protein